MHMYDKLMTSMKKIILISFIMLTTYSFFHQKNLKEKRFEIKPSTAKLTHQYKKEKIENVYIKENAIIKEESVNNELFLRNLKYQIKLKDLYLCYPKKFSHCAMPTPYDITLYDQEMTGATEPTEDQYRSYYGDSCFTIEDNCLNKIREASEIELLSFKEPSEIAQILKEKNFLLFINSHTPQKNIGDKDLFEFQKEYYDLKERELESINRHINKIKYNYPKDN